MTALRMCSLTVTALKGFLLLPTLMLSLSVRVLWRRLHQVSWLPWPTALSRGTSRAPNQLTKSGSISRWVTVYTHAYPWRAVRFPPSFQFQTVERSALKRYRCPLLETEVHMLLLELVLPTKKTSCLKLFEDFNYYLQVRLKVKCGKFPQCRYTILHFENGAKQYERITGRLHFTC